MTYSVKIHQGICLALHIFIIISHWRNQIYRSLVHIRNKQKFIFFWGGSHWIWYQGQISNSSMIYICDMWVVLFCLYIINIFIHSVVFKDSITYVLSNLKLFIMIWCKQLKLWKKLWTATQIYKSNYYEYIWNAK